MTTSQLIPSYAFGSADAFPYELTDGAIDLFAFLLVETEGVEDDVIQRLTVGQWGWLLLCNRYVGLWVDATFAENISNWSAEKTVIYLDLKGHT